MSYSFFATVSRMKYINRWALMRNAREENLSEHSLEVAMIAHALCTIGNVRYGKHLEADQAALIGLYHDASEIITGDMPTPVKYANERIRNAYKDVEADAEQHLLEKLPEDLRNEYKKILCAPENMKEEEKYLRKLVKAADKLSALISAWRRRIPGIRNSGVRSRARERQLMLWRKSFRRWEIFCRTFFLHTGRLWMS